MNTSANHAPTAAKDCVESPRSGRLGTYRLEPISRMCFFSRVRASASTSRFHRSLFHSGPPELVVKLDRAFLRITSGRSIESGGPLILTSRVGMTLDLDIATSVLSVSGHDDRNRDSGVVT